MILNKERLFLISIFIILFIFNYSWIDSFLIKEFSPTIRGGIIERVIDGDTIVVNGTSIRLLGVNSPEKGEIGFNSAKEFLEQYIGLEILIENENERYDLYNRELAYIFREGINLNEELIKKGLANPYFPKGKTKYYSSFFYSFENCIKNGKGLCQEENNSCLQINWEPKKDILELKNICNYNINLEGYSIKDEGRKKFIFSYFLLYSQKETIITSKNFSEDYIWTKTGDSIFIRNKDNKLIYFNYY